MSRSTILSAAFVAGALAVACGAFGTGEDARPATPGGDAQADAELTDAPAGDEDALPGPDGASSGPVLVATSAEPVNWVTSDATRVIWATGGVQGGVGQIFACSKSGCTGPTPLGGTASIGYLASSGPTAFASFGYDQRGIERLEPSGAFTTYPAVTTKNQIFNLYARDGALFYVVYAGAVPYARSVRALSLVSGGVTPIGDYEPGATINTGSFVATSDRVFLGAHNTGAIVTCARASCTFEDFGSGNEYYVSSMATDGIRLFWSAGGPLWSCPTAVVPCPGATNELAISGAVPTVEAVEERDGLLFIERSNGDLLECEASGCASSSRVLAHESRFHPAGPSSRTLVVDDDNVYYVARDGDPDAGNLSYRVMRLPRTPR